jgi:shikimate 5-dehydrogenase
MTKWCVITDFKDEPRFQILNETLKASGVPTEFTQIQATPATLAEALEEAKTTQNQIRIGGRLGAHVLPLLERLPSSVLSLRACDALVCDNNEWWPRFYLVEGLNQTIAHDAATLDLGGSVLVIGATPDARATVAALSRIGFSKMIVSDPSEAACSSFVEELRRSYFGIQFQIVARKAVTQLPGVCSIAVNTLLQSEDSEALNELAYFNFLKPNGFWLDLAILPPNTNLETEALSVGASIISGARALAMTDKIWAETALKIKIDFEAHASSLIRR